MSAVKTERNDLICELYEEGKTNQQIRNELWKKGYKGLMCVEAVGNQVSRLRKAGRITKPRHLVETDGNLWEIQIKPDGTLKVQLNKKCGWCEDMYQVGRYTMYPNIDEKEAICPICQKVHEKWAAEEREKLKGEEE